MPAQNIHLALVVHGKAGFDLLKGLLYQEKFQQKNANSALLQDLMKNQVRVIYVVNRPLITTLAMTC
ncbi:MAG: hypothetical protein ACJAXS_002762 [Colwellia sp.]|jgi:hypothetical protein